MRFLLVAWVPVALGMTDISTPAYLNGIVGGGYRHWRGTGLEVHQAGTGGSGVAIRGVDRALGLLPGCDYQCAD